MHIARGSPQCATTGVESVSGERLPWKNGVLVNLPSPSVGFEYIAASSDSLALESLEPKDVGYHPV